MYTNEIKYESKYKIEDPDYEKKKLLEYFTIE